MQTLIGLVIGIIASLLISHYYFKRAARKSLGLYRTLSNPILAGIDPEVRKQLKVSFRDNEVLDLQQVEFLVANDGERAISSFIEDPKLVLPEGVEVLDASILHRHPETLNASLTSSKEESPSTITLHVPLLNRGEFFLVKLLLKGRVTDDLRFTLQAEDLPRAIALKPVSAAMLSESRFVSDWAAIFVGSIFLVAASALGYVLHLFWKLRPEVSLTPWATFDGRSADSCIYIFAVVATAAMALIGFLLILGIGFEHTWTRGPRFALPTRFRTGAGGIPRSVQIESGGSRQASTSTDV